MSDEESNRFEIPKDMRAMAEASFDQARQTFEKFLAGAQATAGHDGGARRHGPRRRQGYQRKAVGLCRKERAERRSNYAQSLLKAKDLTEVMRLHGEYVTGQMRSLAEQASEMGQAVGRAAMDAAKPKS